jgi:hypothetical protein
VATIASRPSLQVFQMLKSDMFWSGICKIKKSSRFWNVAEEDSAVQNSPVEKVGGGGSVRGSFVGWKGL